MHITSDVAVLHAPDSSEWRWTELGDPYYESVLPSPTLLQQTVLDDYAAQGNDFNLHQPQVAQADISVHMGLNIFEPGPVEIRLEDENGRIVATLFDRDCERLGVYSLDWDASSYPSGSYRIIASRGEFEQQRILQLP